MDFIQKMGLNNLNLQENWSQLVISSEISTKEENGELIKKIDSKQTSLFCNRPSLGANRWFIIDIVRLPDNYIGVRMEDGHKENYAILNYKYSMDKLITVIESLD